VEESVQELEQGSSSPSVSVIVPTYKEVENLPLLSERLERVRQNHNLSLELLIMDDDSQDGTEELVSSINKDWITLVVRKKQRGLSQAVLEGLQSARGEVLVVMDADLSHPPEKIPEMLVARFRDGFPLRYWRSYGGFLGFIPLAEQPSSDNIGPSLDLGQRSDVRLLRASPHNL